MIANGDFLGGKEEEGNQESEKERWKAMCVCERGYEEEEEEEEEMMTKNIKRRSER